MTIDANSILVALMTVLLGLSTWTLYTLHGLAKDNAAREVKEQSQDEQISQTRARLIEAEADISRLQVDVAHLEGKSRH